MKAILRQDYKVPGTMLQKGLESSEESVMGFVFENKEGHHKTWTRAEAEKYPDWFELVDTVPEFKTPFIQPVPEGAEASDCYQVLLSASELVDIETHLKLNHIAQQLNGDWEPDWSNGEEPKFWIALFVAEQRYGVEKTFSIMGSEVYFKTAAMAIKAMNFMGLLNKEKNQ